MKPILFALLAISSATAQTAPQIPSSTTFAGTRAAINSALSKIAPIACFGAPGDTPAAYGQQCQTTLGARYNCNNAAGCTVAADWVWAGAISAAQIGLGAVENTALSTWAGTSNLTTLGTITTGVWHGTAIGDSYIASAATWSAKQAAISGAPGTWPSFGGAALLGVGTTTGTVAAGDDSRLSNARTPTAHASAHQNGGADEIATATPAANAIPKAGSGGTLASGWIPSLSYQAPISGAPGTWPSFGGAALLSVGTTTGTVAAGDDSRLSDARTPTAHASTHQNGGSDEIATATPAANAIPKAGSGGTLARGWIPPPPPVVKKTASYLVLNTDYLILANPTSASVTITAPASPATGQVFVVKNIVYSGTNSVIVSGGAALIDGQASYTVTYMQSLQLIWDGSAWWIL